MRIDLTNYLWYTISQKLRNEDSRDNFFVGRMRGFDSVSKHLKHLKLATQQNQMLEDTPAFIGCDFVFFWNVSSTSNERPDLAFANDYGKMHLLEKAIEETCNSTHIVSTNPQVYPFIMNAADYAYCYYAVPIFIA